MVWLDQQSDAGNRETVEPCYAAGLGPCRGGARHLSKWLTSEPAEHLLEFDRAYILGWSKKDVLRKDKPGKKDEHFS